MEWIPFGGLGKPHGLRGELKFYPPVADAGLCRQVQRVRLGAADAAVEYQVESWRGEASPMIVKLQGCATVEAAQALRGSSVFARRSDFKKLPADELYWFEIENLSVYDESGRYYGRVHSIFSTGANDVYVVRDGRRELLLPAIGWIIKEIDPERQRLVFHLAEGLLQDDAL